MKIKKDVKISYLAHHLITIISVTLVLLLMGIIALIWKSAESETERIKERVEINVILNDSVPDALAKRLADSISSAPYAHGVRLISKQEALENWTRDTGENLEELFGVNPLSIEITFSLKANHTSAEAITAISGELKGRPGVESVVTPDEVMIDTMNENIKYLTLILGIVAAVMILISLVLINNTVHLTIYSRRFLIHTMQLVGATDAFIRRPIVLNNILAGIFAGVIADIVIAAFMAGSKGVGLPDIASFVTWPVYAPVAIGLVAAGALLSGTAAWISANIYLAKDYDRLFK